MSTPLLIILIRLAAGIALCPYVTALLVITPSYVFGETNMFTPVYTAFVFYLSYAVAIIIGIPVTVYLFTKNKCSYTAFAITGFILGFLTLFVFSYYLKMDALTLRSHHHPVTEITDYFFTFHEIKKLLLPSTWYGICAAIGAALFAFISGISPWYNKSINQT